MLPYTPLHYLLFSDAPTDHSQFAALVMTSGNLSEEPIVISNEEAWQQLEPVADRFLFHNRDIYMRTDDSVVRTFADRERVMRRSRATYRKRRPWSNRCRICWPAGAELKHTFVLTKESTTPSSASTLGTWTILKRCASFRRLCNLENYFAPSRRLSLMTCIRTIAALSTRFPCRSSARLAYSITMRTSPAAWLKIICKEKSSESRSTAPAMARMGKSGAENFWSPIWKHLSGALTCAICLSRRRCRGTPALAHGPQLSSGYVWHWSTPGSKCILRNPCRKNKLLSSTP